MIAYFGVEPDFGLVPGTYKNPNDKRGKKLIKSGKCPIYDWWNVNQVKNVSKQKTEQTCQMPVEVMRRCVGVTKSDIVYDPFAGAGTTLVACKMLGRKSVGCELDETYCEITTKRLKEIK
jgi:DNA modification methylase